MKLTCALILMYCSNIVTDGTCGQLEYDYISTETFLTKMEAMRQGRADSQLEITRYDTNLVREYFMHAEPRNKLADLHWVIRGLAKFGTAQDAPKLKRLIEVFREQGSASGGELIYADLALRARGGDRKAFEELLALEAKVEQEQIEFDELLWMCGTAAARDKLWEIASDRSRLNGRLNALEFLGLLRDDRYLTIATDPELIMEVVGNGYPMYDQIVRISGVEELRQVPPERLHAFIVKRKIRLSSPKRILTVKGGIDWSAIAGDNSPPAPK